ncbi:DeoR/GlpR family DNA-binding transcription regulator [Vibrio sp. TH_r3]|uniref:DeoR/GlpR family DNA-binding transcription regulator n=1 Tax=Vibrio sp. TH_r3 TaxID=3082084 RepID=UPI00295566D0|nr:DeoR/GlpR family DNA-binding transcription regulator [Vibrio sp. TH_r3]MDV7105561.1 DeoR/GlpR family DNA-binding transcription regulator [Vibrio sp. TH_r3]
MKLKLDSNEYMELRQQKIMELLNEQGSLFTDDLSNKFKVTTQTIRRDINELCKSGLARKQHGGVTLPPTRDNISISDRTVTNVLVKQKISSAALLEVESGQTVFLSYGSSVAQFARSLPQDIPLTVVTNNLDALAYLTNLQNIEVWVAGGCLRHQHRDLSGIYTKNFFESFRADVAILGIGGISSKGELLEFQFTEGELTKAMLNNSRKSVLLADSSKYLRNASVCISSLEDIDVMYTDCQSIELANLCQAQSVQLNIVEVKS